MLDNKYKASVNFLLYNKTYLFMYDVKTTEPGQFPNPKIFLVNNFQVCICIAVEVQL